VENYAVTVIHLNAQTERAITIEADEAETTDDIILNTQIDGVFLSASSHGYFSAFQKLRDKLLQKGYGVKCVGSKLNAVQSPMASATYKVYEVILGEQATPKNLVCLFNYADISEFPNTAKQNDFFEMWLRSLEKNMKL